MNSTISHRTPTSAGDDASTKQIAADVAQRLRIADRLIMPLDESLELLEQLQEFALGRFLLHNRGLNGYWTAYIFRHVPGEKASSPLEQWLLDDSLLCRARERFHRFKAEIAHSLRDGAVLASVPCGLMDDLLLQDYSGVRDVKLVGVDIDEESLGHAKDNAQARGLADRCEFLAQDAWEMNVDGEFDLLVSNGLNMYEPDPDRLTELYRRFRQALRPGGRLLLSFLTPPPPPPWVAPDQAAAWEKYDIPEADLRRELSLFGDILQAKYLNFCGEADTRRQLESAGLAVEAVHYNENGVLPIAVAVK
ncbi:MAG: SAM-dependent methyltransferase [Stackebrandtia sp.]